MYSSVHSELNGTGVLDKYKFNYFVIDDSLNIFNENVFSVNYIFICVFKQKNTVIQCSILLITNYVQGVIIAYVSHSWC